MAETKIVFDAADDYERFMGAWSRSIGERFLAWLDPPRDARWVDLGCGTGAFSELILRRCAPKSLTGIDPSPEQIAYVRKHLPGHTFEVGDSMAMRFGEGAFDVVASALVFHFIPDRQKAFAEFQPARCPNADLLCARVLSLPMHAFLSDVDVERVMDGVISFFK